MKEYSDDPPAVDVLRQVEALQQRDKLTELCIAGLRDAVKSNKEKPRKNGMTPEKATDYAYNWFGVHISFEPEDTALD